MLEGLRNAGGPAECWRACGMLEGLRNAGGPAECWRACVGAGFSLGGRAKPGCWSNMTPIRTQSRKHHRLPRGAYIGVVSISITACIDARKPIFTKDDIVATFVDFLRNAVMKNNCIVPVYCFMPDHVHMLVS